MDGCPWCPPPCKCRANMRATTEFGVIHFPGCPVVWQSPDQTPDPDPDTLCRFHYAEYEGLPVAELDRRDTDTQYDSL